MAGFGEGAVQSIDGRGNKQDERRWYIFGKMGTLFWTLFCTKGFKSNELFQISRNYKTENVHHRQNF